MGAAIDFYFDFSSAYAYIAQARLDEFERRHGVRFQMRPFSLGAVFKALGSAPPDPTTPRGRYIYNDVGRCARQYGLALNWPSQFPFNSIPAARAFYAISETDPDGASDFAKAAFAYAYGEGGDLADKAAILRLAADAGEDVAAAAAGLDGEPAKAALKAATQAALERGVFGSPTFLVGDEMFWGADRLDQLGQWLERGGW